MPAIGETDPTDLAARARAELGFSRQLEQPRRVAHSPRFGGAGGGNRHLSDEGVADCALDQLQVREQQVVHPIYQHCPNCVQHVPFSPWVKEGIDGWIIS